MAGLPRSGSTLLSAILNQHPDIYSSPQTDLLQMIYLLHENIQTFESYQAGINHQGYENVVRKLGNSFYSHVEKPIIIDKNRAWGTPYNLNLAPFLNPNVKILLPYRPILEILTSFIVLANQNPRKNFIDQKMEETDFFSRFYRNIDDARCEWLMQPNGKIDQAILSLSQIKKNPDKFLLINYHDLIENCQKTMNLIYSFLGISNFEHNLTRITQIEKPYDLDEQIFGIPNLHKIRPSLKVISKNPENVLSSYVVKKYGQTLDFI
jgi:sulfotransferase